MFQIKDVESQKTKGEIEFFKKLSLGKTDLWTLFYLKLIYLNQFDDLGIDCVNYIEKQNVIPS